MKYVLFFTEVDLELIRFSCNISAQSHSRLMAPGWQTFPVPAEVSEVITFDILELFALMLTVISPFLGFNLDKSVQLGLAFSGLHGISFYMH
jgi:hypothetical protein